MQRLTALFQPHGLELDIRWRSASVENIYSLVDCGRGFTFVNSGPATATTFDGLEVVYAQVADAIEQKSVVAIPPASHPMPRWVAALELPHEVAQCQP